MSPPLATAYPRRNGRYAISISLLLHVLLILCWRGVTQRVTLPSEPLQVRLQLWQPQSRPAQPEPQKRPVVTAPSVQPVRRTEPKDKAATTEVVPAQPSASTPAPATLSLPEALPATSLTERALAGVRDAEASLKREGEQRQHLLPRAELPENLRKLPPPVLTALAKSFDNQLSELVVLEIREQQEGSNRVTMYYTNKGVYCAYTPIIKKSFLRNSPTVTQFGTCSPQ
ncbi:hypothetical protein [Chitinimonas sp.]|uniref:hypothetical protein n=1 Tax=Chitinimonas sp. TaxID=1934313 RepID=UPI002F93481B